MLEINLEYDFVFLNCGIVFYYGGCVEFVINDLNCFFEKDDSDLFCVLWVYFVYYDVLEFEG